MIVGKTLHSLKVFCFQISISIATMNRIFYAETVVKLKNTIFVKHLMASHSFQNKMSENKNFQAVRIIPNLLYTLFIRMQINILSHLFQ